MSKILSTHWFSQGQDPFCFGVVVVETEVGERKAYIGVIKGYDEEKDAYFIKDHGSRIDPAILKQILRDLDKTNK